MSYKDLPNIQIKDLIKTDPPNKDAAQVIEKICNAFQDVELEDGIGLWRAEEMDDCIHEGKIDEKYQWLRLNSHDLNQCFSALSFFDAKGMRFHIPALMILVCYEQFFFDIEFSLTKNSNHSKNQFILINADQKNAILSFLNYLLKREHECLHEFIYNAIKTWDDE